MYVDYAYGTESRETAQAVWRDREFVPLDRIDKNDELSYLAFVRSLVRWRVADYDASIQAREKRVTWRKEMEHVPLGGAPVAEIIIRRLLHPKHS